MLTAYNNGTGGMRQWVLFAARYQPSRAAIARFLEHRQIRPRPNEREAAYAEAQRERTVEIFCALDEQGFPKPPRCGQAYALLPTGVNVPLGLHVQADWLLYRARSQIELLSRGWRIIVWGMGRRSGWAWVYDPQSGGEKIPPLLQEQVRERLIRRAAKIVPGKEDWLRVRFSGVFCYMDAQVPGESVVTHLCRLRYLDKPDRWSMAFYTYSHERYEPCVFRSGRWEGTPEEALDIGAMYIAVER
jgi:hypothetical protein